METSRLIPFDLYITYLPYKKPKSGIVNILHTKRLHSKFCFSFSKKGFQDLNTKTFIPKENIISIIKWKLQD